jgi:uncharacterized damage-inducible protein DinB
VQDILTLYEYNYWANGRILAAAANAGHEQFGTPYGHSSGDLDFTMFLNEKR